MATAIYVPNATVRFEILFTKLRRGEPFWSGDEGPCLQIKSRIFRLRTPYHLTKRPSKEKIAA